MTTEVAITTNKMNHLIDPVLSIWGWEVPVYLFLGGLTAGVLIVSAVLILMDRSERYRVAGRRLLFLAPVLLSLGMGALFLDLEHKLYVWRFYATFKPLSPMSWGAWILLLVYPLNVLMMLGVIRSEFPGAHTALRDHWLPKLPRRLGWLGSLYERGVEWSERNLRPLAASMLPIGIALGIYTGILLSANVARPFWNVSILGPLFLVSGISTALALVMLLTADSREYRDFSRLDIAFMAFELLLLFLFGYNMFTSTAIQQAAIGLITGGSLTVKFWLLFFGLGLLAPLVVELAELRGIHVNRKIAPALVLFGGLMFRIVVVEAGQISSWFPLQ